MKAGKADGKDLKELADILDDDVKKKFTVNDHKGNCNIVMNALEELIDKLHALQKRTMTAS